MTTMARSPHRNRLLSKLIVIPTTNSYSISFVSYYVFVPNCFLSCDGPAATLYSIEHDTCIYTVYVTIVSNPIYLSLLCPPWCSVN